VFPSAILRNSQGIFHNFFERKYDRIEKKIFQKGLLGGHCSMCRIIPQLSGIFYARKHGSELTKHIRDRKNKPGGVKISRLIEVADFDPFWYSKCIEIIG